MSIIYVEGHWRSAWVLDSRPNDISVLKSLQRYHPYDSHTFQMIRYDALVMDVFSASDRIVNMYGYCGMSVLVEALLGSSIEDVLLPPSIHIEYKEREIRKNAQSEEEEDVEYSSGSRDDGEENDDSSSKDDEREEKKRSDDEHFSGEEEVKYSDDSFQPLTSAERLIMALNMSEAIAELHGFEHGVIIHYDIHLEQFLFNEDGVIKLSDFNRADIMAFNEETGTYCKYMGFEGGGGGSVRSPEEYNSDPLNEKLDVYSFGNILYTLLYQYYPYFEYNDDYHTVRSGIPPTIDEAVADRSYADDVLLRVMKLCYERDPEQRIDIFGVVSILREAVEQNEMLNH